MHIRAINQIIHIKINCPNTFPQSTSHFIARRINLVISVIKRHKNNQTNQEIGITNNKIKASSPPTLLQ